MPRLVVEHLKNEKTSRSISIEVDGSIIGEISAGSARDFFIFFGKHTIIAKVGSERSDPIEISIDERDIILFQCWSTGLIKKRVILRSISQKTQKNRFYIPDENKNRNERQFIENDVMENSWRSILGVSTNATGKQIRDSYIILMKANHPDKISDLNSLARKEAEERAIEITTAYNYAKKLVK